MVKTSRKTTENLRIPGHLRTITKKWFREVVEGYALEPHHLKVLTLACESWQRAQDAEAALRTGGLTYKDRFGRPHPRPEVKIKEQAELIFARLVRELNLDIEPPRDTGRPPGLY
jgi:phage terminase small subunit